MASYSVRFIPLDTVFERELISPPGQAIPQVGIQSLPSAAADGTTLLHFGDGDGIPLYLMGQSLNSVPAENGGLYMTNRTAKPGAVICLVIGYTVDLEIPRQH